MNDQRPNTYQSTEKYLLSDLFNGLHLLFQISAVQQHIHGDQNDNPADKTAGDGVHHFAITLAVYGKAGDHRRL